MIADISEIQTDIHILLTIVVYDFDKLHSIMVFSIAVVSMEELLDMASSRMPTLRGIKFTHEDLMEYSRCLAHSSGKYLMMYGRDEVNNKLIFLMTSSFSSYSKYLARTVWEAQLRLVALTITLASSITACWQLMSVETSQLLNWNR